MGSSKLINQSQGWGPLRKGALKLKYRLTIDRDRDTSERAILSSIDAEKRLSVSPVQTSMRYLAEKADSEAITSFETHIRAQLSKTIENGIERKKTGHRRTADWFKKVDSADAEKASIPVETESHYCKEFAPEADSTPNLQ